MSKLTVSVKMRNRAIIQSQMQTEEFKQYARLRNGVETVPSLLKNRYGVNGMHAHGKIRCKFSFGNKDRRIEFQKALPIPEGFGRLCLKSGSVLRVAGGNTSLR